jgi:hypothetical protein
MERYGHSMRARQPLAKDAKSKPKASKKQVVVDDINTKVPWEVPKNWKPLTEDALSVANKGNTNKDGVRPDKWYIYTKKKHRGVQLSSSMPMFVGPAGARWSKGFDGIFASRAEATARIPAFCRAINGARESSKRVESSTPVAAKKLVGVDELDRISSLKRKEMAAVVLTKRAAEVKTAMRSKLQTTVPDHLALELASCTRKNVPASHVADLYANFAAVDRNRREENRTRVANEREVLKSQKKRTKYPSYYLPKEERHMLKLKKWSKARVFLAPFLRDQTTDGLVLMKNGNHSTAMIDLSVTGTDRILKKASIVYLFCGLRMQGKSAAEAVSACTMLHPRSDRMSSSATVYRYLNQFFEHSGFFETSAGKWVRETVWSNPHLLFAMKTFIEANTYKVMKDVKDPESQKYFIAKHAADHLNTLLMANPDLRCNRLYAAEFPVSEKTMQRWMGTVFDHYWRRNQKGTANQIHERTDAVSQRDVYIYDGKWRQLQNLTWHQLSMRDLRREMPHLYDLAQLSKNMIAEQALGKKNLGGKVQAELVHNVHIFSKMGALPCGPRLHFTHGDLEEMVEVKADEWVEIHVDLLDVRQRQELYPFWGGAMSVRCDLTKVFAFPEPYH